MACKRSMATMEMKEEKGECPLNLPRWPSLKSRGQYEAKKAAHLALHGTGGQGAMRGQEGEPSSPSLSQLDFTETEPSSPSGGRVKSTEPSSAAPLSSNNLSRLRSSHSHFTSHSSMPLQSPHFKWIGSRMQKSLVPNLQFHTLSPQYEPRATVSHQVSQESDTCRGEVSSTLAGRVKIKRFDQLTGRPT